jgi:hypothetical protein
MASELTQVLRTRSLEISQELNRLVTERLRIDGEVEELKREQGHIDALLGTNVSASLSEAIAPRISSATSLDAFRPNSGDSPPAFLQIPGGEERAIRNWKDLLLQVVRWLCESGKLTDADCPVRQERATKRFLVSSSPTHIDGGPFREPAQPCKGIFVETHAGARVLTEQAAFLLRHFQVDPKTFSIYPQTIQFRG